MISYPKTYHLEGSKGSGDDPDHVDLDDLRGSDLIVFEEKLDGSELSIRFDSEGRADVRHRNNPIEGQVYSEFWPWFYRRSSQLSDVLGTRYVLFGEWMYACHTVFYDALPSYFMFYDVYDREAEKWLTLLDRLDLLEDTDLIHAPVRNVYDTVEDIKDHHFNVEDRLSLFVSPSWQDKVDVVFDGDFTPLGCMEGLYVKTEKDGELTGFYKYINPAFIEAILDGDTHWKDRTLVPNQLKAAA